MQAFSDTLPQEPELEAKKLMDWTKWSLLRAVAAEGLDANALRRLPTGLLRKKLLLRVSRRTTDSYINKTDYYILNVQAARCADPDRWLSETSTIVKPRPGFQRITERR